MYLANLKDRTKWYNESLAWATPPSFSQIDAGLSGIGDSFITEKELYDAIIKYAKENFILMNKEDKEKLTANIKHEIKGSKGKINQAL